MAWTNRFRLVRADDQIVLDVEVDGLEPVKDPSGQRRLVLRPTGTEGRIRLQFGPQQLLETAAPPEGVREPQDRPIFTPPTEVVLRLHKDDRAVPVSVAGLLEAASRLPLVVPDANGDIDPLELVDRPVPSALELVAASMAPRLGRPGDPVEAAHNRAADRAARRAAVAPPRAVEASGARGGGAPPAGPARPPVAGGQETLVEPAAATGPVGGFPAATRFHLPYRLGIRPPGGATRLIHADRPVEHDGRVELWTSRLEVLAARGGSAETPLDVRLDALTENPGGTGAWRTAVDDTKLQNSLTVARCGTIATQTAAKKATLRRLRLSSIGAWLDLRGDWPDLGGDRPDLGVVSLHHDSAQGRDQLQRIVEVGSLYPFKFPAIQVTETVRQFDESRLFADTDGDGVGDGPFQPGTRRTASLATTATITVIDPVVDYTLEDVPQPNAWPFDEVRILLTVTPAGAGLPASGPGVPADVTVLHVRGAPFRFPLRGLDRTGQPVDFSMPLLFVPKDRHRDEAADMRRIWKQQGTGFTEVDLAAQTLAVAPAPPLQTLSGARSGGAGEATTVVTETLSLVLDEAQGGVPVAETLLGRVPALDTLVKDAEAVTLSYAGAYAKDAFTLANEQGQLVLALAQDQALQLGGELTGGLASLGLPITALSAAHGAVAGANLDKLASGEVDLSFLTGVLEQQLLGLVPLDALIPDDLDLKLGDAYQLVTDVLDGVTSQVLIWEVPLFEPPKTTFPAGFVRLVPAGDPPGSESMMRIKQTTEVDPVRQEARSTSECRLEQIEVQIHSSSNPAADAVPLVAIPFKHISFVSHDAEKPDVDLDMGKLRFGGVLGFVATLLELIDVKGFNDPPALAVSPNGVTSTFEFPVPAVAVGMFALENINIGARLELPFTSGPLSLRFNFATPDNPFRLTVAALSGGGNLAIGLSAGGLTELVGALEFGASISVNLVVAKGSVEAMGGVRFAIIGGKADISGYFRIRGEVDVLSLVSVSVTLTLTLLYDFNTDELTGTAQLAICIKILFFSETVVIEMERRFAGSNADPTFAELMAPEEWEGDLPWNVYCAAFSEEP